MFTRKDIITSVLNKNKKNYYIGVDGIIIQASKDFFRSRSSMNVLIIFSDPKSWPTVGGDIPRIKQQFDHLEIEDFKQKKLMEETIIDDLNNFLYSNKKALFKIIFE